MIWKRMNDFNAVYAREWNRVVGALQIQKQTLGAGQMEPNSRKLDLALNRAHRKCLLAVKRLVEKELRLR